MLVSLSDEAKAPSVLSFASVAQLVEQRTENPRVVGSIPTGGTISPQASLAGRTNASVAHLVERHLAKVEVASSSLVTRSKTGQRNLPRFFLKCISLSAAA